MSDKTFVDTNILVYAHDSGAGQRHETAREHVRQLWLRRSGVISTQVLQELYVNVRRKARNPVSRAEAKGMIRDYLCWEVVVNDGEAILEAIDLQTRYSLSFWDALIVGAANAAGATRLLSEDMCHGQLYGSVEVVDPFRP